MDALLKLVWILLLAAPVAALALRTLINRLPARSQEAAAKPLSLVLGVFLVVVILANLAGIRFVPLIANIWTLAAAYFAYCFLAFGIGRLPLPGLVRSLALVVSALPIAFGYFLGSVGLLGLMFMVGSYANPSKETRLATDLVCTRIDGGGPSGGYALHVHREWAAAPAASPGQGHRREE
ncbi:hypothetical protein [Caulobacter sp. RL271]|uniref:Uncharacterized protein n=1 Tax=Caulobacter segnis TaxID=88688 RepID=A0ABY4ZQJ3_9CAUL|nr:hypothetical protein [Caulobacter segnis]USQ94251.1 hypothetical protein MZV50_16780 [Caulobacter segnis]